MDLSLKTLSDIIIFSKYSRYIPEFKRREVWSEIVDRNKQMHLKKFPFLSEEIEKAYEFVYSKKVLPSMRSLQFGGKPIAVNPVKLFNCSFLPVNDWRAFQEIMFLLLSGCGVGVSLQKHHVEDLPVVRKPLNRKRRFLVGDSVEGWSDSISVLMKSYFNNQSDIDFDYSDIRPKGSPLVTSGGTAPGCQPLKDCIHNIRKVLDNVETGRKLKPIEAHDIVCFIADAVLSGGIRRAALISMFSLEDQEMLTSKFGKWYENNPQRARANNSAVILRHRVEKEVFMTLWDKIKKNHNGEPAFIFTNDTETLANPCNEASLKAFTFCNLVEINFCDIEDQEDFIERCKAAAFIGTLQASFTNYHYLRDIWKRNTEKDSLLGVSLTGLASRQTYDLDLKAGVKIIKEENKRVAKLLNINPAARLTCVKPAGTSSLVLGTSSGIHAWFSKYYIRRIRMNKDEVIYKYLIKKIPQLIEEDFEKPHLGAVLSIPIKSPEDAILREDETALGLLERIKKTYIEWVKPGFVSGNNNHNISATVSLKENEWDEVGEWLWDNKQFYNGISILPYDENSYNQMPLEEITEEEYKKLFSFLSEIDVTEITEEKDNVKLQSDGACGGGSCTIHQI
jgi:ribonucleoside-diphosphate reductase alpha chain